MLVQVHKPIDKLLKALTSFCEDQKSVFRNDGSKGTEIGRSFEELAAIIERIDLKDKVSVTWILTVMMRATLFVTTFDGVLEEFDRTSVWIIKSYSSMTRK